MSNHQTFEDAVTHMREYDGKWLDEGWSTAECEGDDCLWMEHTDGTRKRFRWLGPGQWWEDATP